MNRFGNLPITARDTPISTRIRGSERKSLTGAWLTLLLPLGIGAIFILRAHMPFFMKPGVPNPIMDVLGFVAAVMLGRAIWETIRLKRFGDPALDLTRVPIPLGGTIEGRITLGSGLTTASDFSMKLQCIRRVLQQGAKNDHWVETVLWSGEKTASLQPWGIVPVSLTVPPDQPETNADDPFNQILWRLTVKAPFRGPAFLEKYQIPVEGRTSAAQIISDESVRVGDSVPVTGKKLFAATLPFLIVGLAICAGSVYLLSLGFADITNASASAHWPSVSGQIHTSISPRVAPRDGVMTGNSISFRAGSTGSKVMGYSFLALLGWGLALWWVT